MKISIQQVIDRYSAGFGYVAANMLGVGFNRAWSENSDIPVFQVTSANFADVTFESNSTGKSYSFGLQIEEEKENVYYLGPPLMFSFNRGKKCVETEIDRSEIEVLEYFGLKPYEIKIQGILVDVDEHQYPREKLKLINEIFSTPGTFKVTGDIFLDLGITEIFFRDDFQIDFVEGYADTVKFSVSAKMTHPLEIKAVGVL